MSTNRFFARPWIFLALLLIAFTVAARLVSVETYPPSIHNDESGIGVYGIPPYLPPNNDPIMWGYNNFGGHANFGPWLTSLPARVMGRSTLLTLRFASATSGILSVVFFFLFCRLAFGTRVALLFVACVAPFHLHIHYSRAGCTYINAVLMTGVVCYLFARLVASHRKLDAVLLGVGLGFAVMVYSATHILPAAIVIGLVGFVLSPGFKERHPSRRWMAGLGYLALTLCGLLISLGRQIMFTLQHGGRSRLESQFVLLDVSRSQWEKGLGPHVTSVDILWANFLRTIKFFYQADSAGQYGFSSAPLDTYSSGLAIIGALVLLFRCFRFDPNAMLVVAIAVGTVAGSTLMIEANFSPHLIAFSIILPFAMAYGLDRLFALVRMNSPILASVVALPLLVTWSMWNYNYYDRHTKRVITRDVWILRLPVDHFAVRSIVNVSSQPGDISESFYKLVYQNAKPKILTPENAPQQIASFGDPSLYPALFIVDSAAAADVDKALAERGRHFKRFDRDNAGGVVFIVETPPSQTTP